jgi:hypothetical protein
MAYDIPTRFHQGISEKCVGQTFDGRKKKNNNKKRSKHNMSPKLCLEAIINAIPFTKHAINKLVKKQASKQVEITLAKLVL